VARQLLASVNTQPIRLNLDASKIGAGHQLVMVAMAYHHRALPITWTWVTYAKGCVPTATPLALSKQIYALLPDQARAVN
jgi:hypothetical protein